LKGTNVHSNHTSRLEGSTSSGQEGKHGTRTQIICIRFAWVFECITKRIPSRTTNRTKPDQPINNDFLISFMTKTKQNKTKKRNLLLVQHLNGMVPSHTTVGSSASDKNNLGLSTGRGHDRGGRHKGTGQRALGRKGGSGTCKRGEHDQSGREFHYEQIWIFFDLKTILRRVVSLMHCFLFAC